MTNELELGLDLLDRQLLDSRGAPCGKVDDLELYVFADGPPRLVAILVGPGALGPRISGFVGRWIVNVWRRLHPDRDPEPVRIPWEWVEKVDYAIHLKVDATTAGLVRSEEWARIRLIDRIPGAR